MPARGCSCKLCTPNHATTLGHVSRLRHQGTHCVHVSPTPAGSVYAPEQLPVQSSQTALGKPLPVCMM